MRRDEFDVIIIGAGLGGLLCAVMLAKEGMKVCVLEKNRQIGGCLQTFALRKKVFDACVHYIGGLGEGHTLHRIFSYAGIMDNLRLQSLDGRGFDRILFGDEQEEFPIACREHFIESLLPFFPQEEAAIKKYISFIKYISSTFPLYNLRADNGENKAALMGLELMSTLRDITKNERLVQVLAGNNLLYAGVDGLTPFYVHAMSTEGYLHSAHKVLPGSSEIAKALWRELQKHGGTIVRNADVARLSEENGKVAFAETEDGERYFAPHFIVAVHPSVLLALTDGKAFRPGFKERLKRLPQTPPALMLNLVLKPRSMAYSAHNLYWHPGSEALAKRNAQGNIHWPDSQAFFWGEDKAHPGFADTLSILAYASADDFALWGKSQNTAGIRARRTDDYEAKKEQLSERLLAKTFHRFPDLQSAILARSTATPLTLRDYTGSPSGALYGSLKDAANPLQSLLSARTRISNLLLTGQNLNMHGVMGVSISAIATCAELLGLEHLLSRIRKA